MAGISPRCKAAAARKQKFLDAIDYPETRRYVAEITERYGNGRDR